MDWEQTFSTFRTTYPTKIVNTVYTNTWMKNNLKRHYPYWLLSLWREFYRIRGVILVLHTIWLSFCSGAGLYFRRVFGVLSFSSSSKRLGFSFLSWCNWILSKWVLQWKPQWRRPRRSKDQYEMLNLLVGVWGTNFCIDHFDTFSPFAGM